MDTHEVEAILAGCEQALSAGGRVDLRSLGFWRAVAAVKRRPDWVEHYADRIGAIDRVAFERTIRPTFPLGVGTAGLSLGALAGLVLAGLAPAVPRRPRGLLALAGCGLLLGTTHDLAHLLVGRLLGIRFTHWFLDGPARLQPGLKVDYASYLRTPAVARAWMHAAGALVTKIVPVLVLGLTARARLPSWTVATLLGIGAAQVIADLLWSVRQSDWRRFGREWRVASRARPRPATAEVEDMRVDLHAKVLTRDGASAGHVQHAVVDPNTNEVTDFVVSTGGLLGKDVLVPRAELDQAAAEGDVLRLRLDKHELERLPTYQPADYGAPPVGWVPPPSTTFPYAGLLWPATSLPPAIPPSVREPWQAAQDVLIDKGSLVIDRSGADVGVVEDIVLEAGGTRLEALDVRLGGALRTLLPGGEVIRLDIDLVESVDPEQVRLRVERNALRAQHR
jgi:sporulation protein YlmC with PRC-barrel domain